MAVKNPDLLRRLAELEDQIARLAKVIMEEVDGEPSKSEGAVDTAIRLLRAAYARRPDPVVSRDGDLAEAFHNGWESALANQRSGGDLIDYTDTVTDGG